MLRCSELMRIKVPDVKLNFVAKIVTFLIRKPKMDQAALGRRHTLKCCGKWHCTRLCP